MLVSVLYIFVIFLATVCSGGIYKEKKKKEISYINWQVKG